MKFNYRNFIIAAMAVSSMALVASCGSDDPSDDPEFDSVAVMQGDPFTVTVLGDGLATVASTATCTVKLDRNRNIAEINADDLRFSNLKFKLGSDGQSYVIESAGVNAEGSGDRVNLNMLYSGIRSINDTQCSGIGLRIATSRSTTNYIPRTLMCAGITTTTLTTVPDSSYVSKETTYTITIDPATSTADLIVHRPKFAAAMPALGDMTFPDLNVSFTNRGFTLTKDAFEPLIDGTPYPRYAITGLQADFDLTSPEATIDFNCMRVFHVSAVISSNFAPKTN